MEASTVLPAGQLRHPDVEPSVGLYWVAGQVRHSVFPVPSAYLPAGQMLHAVLPSTPTARPTGQASHSVLSAFMYSPMAHLVQASLPAAEILPSSQTEHTDAAAVE